VSTTQVTGIPTPRPDGGARGSLLVADRIVTLGHGRYRARAMLIRGKRVVWVGDDPDQAPPYGERIDLAGCTIGPAFVDSHVHLTPTGITLTGLDLSGARSGREILRAVQTYAAQHTGRVVWGHGYDPHGFADDLPSPDALAEAGQGMAVFLSRADGHSCIVDSLTLAAAPLARAHGVERDAQGRPTGILKREANHILRRWSIGAMTSEELTEARRVITRHAASLGIASVHEMGGPDIMGPDDFDVWRYGRWPVEIVPYWGGLDLRFVVERDLKQIGGDLFVDGSLGSHTAALSGPYADRDHERGHLEYSDDTLVELFREATHAGIQVGTHAIGDAAIEQVLRCWRLVDDELPEYLEGGVHRLRHRIEHAEVLRPDLLEDIADLGLVVSAQPQFEARWGSPGGMYESRLGPERAAWMNPYRALADRGVPLAFGSDANVTPMDPWGTVHAAQRRHRDEHSVTRLEAVSAMALGGRHAARQDRFVGTIRAGMRADVAVWEGDPFRADDPRGARCALTLVKGRVTHGDAPLPRWDDEPGSRSHDAQ
jgi:hypothetical protein